jgi:hypothetical protein
MKDPLLSRRLGISPHGGGGEKEGVKKLKINL